MFRKEILHSTREGRKLSGEASAAGSGGPIITPYQSVYWKNPKYVYEHPPGLGGDYDTFKLQQPGAPPLHRADRERAWKTATEFLDQKKANQIGFQANLCLNYSKTRELTHFQDTLLNNIGDPFANGSYNLHTKFLERPLLDYFASLWNAEWPSNRKQEDSYWGFSLSMGGTEGNLYGMWNGRDYLAGKVLLVETETEAQTRMAKGSAKRAEPIYVQAEYENFDTKSMSADDSLQQERVLCFFSTDTHYSMAKAAVILNITTFSEEGKNYYKEECPIEAPEDDDKWKEDGWPSQVPSNKDGTINIDALEALVKFFAEKAPERRYSFLFCFNYGTVFKGAYDNIEEAAQRLIPIFQQNGLFERNLKYRDRLGMTGTVKRNGWWFHVDGALGAAYMPFIELARKTGHKIPGDDTSRSYRFDFGLKIPVEGKEEPYPLVHSISMSGHKWIGAPVPCGIFMTKTKYQLQPPQKADVTYIGSPDTTFAGSRSGFAAAILWDHFSQRSFDDLIQKAIYTQDIACYLVAELTNLEVKIKKKLWISRSKLSLGVVFLRPTPEIVLKYSLSKEEDKDIGDDGKPFTNYVVHAYAMQHVTHSLIDALIKDCSVDGAFDYNWSPSAQQTDLKPPLTPPLSHERDLIGW